MDILFTRSRDRRDQTLVTRDDGVRLTVPVFGPLDPLPHDLAHYVIEPALGQRDGFWGTVAAGGLFAGMRIVAGRQRPYARERSRALMKANHAGIIFSEVVVDVIVGAVKGEPPGSGPLPVESPLAPMRTTADRLALIARLRPPMQDMCARWQAIPLGATFLVTWPDRTLRSASNPTARGQYRPVSAGARHGGAPARGRRGRA